MMFKEKKITDLTEFQKKQIKKRLSLDFYKELNSKTEAKSNFLKAFSDKIESLVIQFDDKGILFYSINIELPFLLNENEENMWKCFHTEIEEFINYIGSFVELVEFCYFSIETFNKIPFIKGLIGIRSILGFRIANYILFELRELFCISFYDIKIDYLVNYSKILEYWKIIIKQNNFKFHRFINYSNFFPEVYGAIADEELKFDDRSAFSQENHFISDTMNVSGIGKKKPKNKDIILYLLRLFMQHNNMILYQNKIFLKKSDSKVTWQFIYNLDIFKEKFNDIVNSLKKIYFQQLNNFDSTELILTDLDLVFSKIKKNNVLLSPKDCFSNIIEFKDGIFFFDNKEFKKFTNICNTELQCYKTIYYIDRFFSDLDLNSATFWLNALYDIDSIFLLKKLFK